MQLTKTDYILWRDCPHNSWLKKWRRTEYDLCAGGSLSDFDLSIIETGNHVEEQARKLFPDGVLVTSRGEDAVAETKQLIADGATVIFQATFSDGELFAAIDILISDRTTSALTILEVKATTDPKVPGKNAARFLEDPYVQDVGFQIHLLRKLGHVVERAAIVRLNGKYVRRGELDRRDLFIEDDVLEFLNGVALQSIAEDVAKAQTFIARVEEPDGPCGCIYRGRSNHCTCFAHFNPNVGAESVHDITFIGSTKELLKRLVDNRIFKIADVPKDFGFTQERQLQHIEAHQSGRSHIDREAIEGELKTLQYPLYFLDYETFAPAVPRFDGYRPFQQMPFQYSLHVVRSPESEPEHFEFLHTDDGDPAEPLFESLWDVIGESGSIVVWSKAMEGTLVHERQKDRLPEYATFLDGLNARMYDLMVIFQKRYHVMPAYRGRTSIKYILPALVGWSYAEMNIGNGTEAMNTWNRIVGGEIVGTEREQKRREMLDYCALDTKAMWGIWKKLREKIGS